MLFLFFCYNTNMNAEEIRRKFLDFFKDRGHAIVPSSSLIPSDPSVLLTTAGMQQFKPYYTGDADPVKDFGSKNTASIQKSFRTSDIDEVGDDTHLTFFEMLGNFSFGGYGKKEAIRYAHDFLKEIGLEIEYVTVFGGDEKTAADEESEKIWQDLLPAKKITKAGRKDNFWGPTGKEGPCGPTTEIYIGGTEIWNIVFNEYYCALDGSFKKLMPLGVDTGMGLERLATILQKKKHIFETDLFAPLIALLPVTLDERKKKIIVDHLRGSAFLIADGILPSNKDAGYVLRRLMRRVLVYEHILQIPAAKTSGVFTEIHKLYGKHYAELSVHKQEIDNMFTQERERFAVSLSQGIKKLEKLSGDIDALSAFQLYETFGIPFEIIKELGGKRAEGLTREAFNREFAQHQKKSRSGREKKFGGHGLALDTGELKAATEEEVKKVTRLHTATHLLQTALRKTLGNEIRQRGSDITAKRLRFDFNFSRAPSAEELNRVEQSVQEMIRNDYVAIIKETDFDSAVRGGALFVEGKAYPPRVSVYQFVDRKTGAVVSSEICGGPHVKHTGMIGAFRIVKQEAVGSGIRRIRAVVEP